MVPISSYKSIYLVCALHSLSNVLKGCPPLAIKDSHGITIDTTVYSALLASGILIGSGGVLGTAG